MAPPRKKPAAAAKAAPKKAPTRRRKPKTSVNTVESAPKESRFEIDFTAFTNTAEWPLYHLNEYVRAKQVTEDSYVPDARKHAVVGDYVVVGEDHQVKVLGKEDFESRYVVIKGPHKRDF